MDRLSLAERWHLHNLISRYKLLLCKISMNANCMCIFSFANRQATVRHMSKCQFWHIQGHRADFDSRRQAPSLTPPTAAQTGSLAVVVTLEENGCCSDFFSMKTLKFQFHFVLLHWSCSRPLCNLKGKSALRDTAGLAAAARVPGDIQRR